MSSSLDEILAFGKVATNGQNQIHNLSNGFLNGNTDINKNDNNMDKYNQENHYNKLIKYNENNHKISETQNFSNLNKIKTNDFDQTLDENQSLNKQFNSLNRFFPNDLKEIRKNNLVELDNFQTDIGNLSMNENYKRNRIKEKGDLKKKCIQNTCNFELNNSNLLNKDFDEINKLNEDLNSDKSDNFFNTNFKIIDNNLVIINKSLIKTIESKNSQLDCLYFEIRNLFTKIITTNKNDAELIREIRENFFEFEEIDKKLNNFKENYHHFKDNFCDSQKSKLMKSCIEKKKSLQNDINLKQNLGNEYQKLDLNETCKNQCDKQINDLKNEISKLEQDLEFEIKDKQNFDVGLKKNDNYRNIQYKLETETKPDCYKSELNEKDRKLEKLNCEIKKLTEKYKNANTHVNNLQITINTQKEVIEKLKTDMKNLKAKQTSSNVKLNEDNKLEPKKKRNFEFKNLQELDHNFLKTINDLKADIKNTQNQNKRLMSVNSKHNVENKKLIYLLNAKEETISRLQENNKNLTEIYTYLRNNPSCFCKENMHMNPMAPNYSGSLAHSYNQQFQFLANPHNFNAYAQSTSSNFLSSIHNPTLFNSMQPALSTPFACSDRTMQNLQSQNVLQAEDVFSQQIESIPQQQLQWQKISNLTPNSSFLYRHLDGANDLNQNGNINQTSSNVTNSH